MNIPIVTPLTRGTGDKVAALKDDIAAVKGNVAEFAEDAADAAGREVKGGVRKSRTYIRKHPLRAFGLVAAAGLISGWLLRR